MKRVKLLKIEIMLIAENDVMDDYAEELVDRAIQIELFEVAQQNKEQPIKFYQVKCRESHDNVLVDDDYALPSS